MVQFANSILSGLLGDAEIAERFSVEADLEAMLRFELALAQACAENELISKQSAQSVESAIGEFTPDLEGLTQGVAIDGVVVLELVRQFREQAGEEAGSAFHYGATSQDVIDSSLILRLKQCSGLLEERLKRIIGLLDARIEEFGDNSISGRTRMQKAEPITVQDRLAVWKTPLQTHLLRLKEFSPRVFQVQLGGAVGTLDRYGYKGQDVKRELAERLGLQYSPANWHARRDGLAEFAGWLSLVSGSLGKIGQDIALMAQNELGEIGLSGTGGSSAMAHKKNPVKAEALVTLARFNATQLSGMHQALVHEQERSGAAWTLEWMILPQMVIATGASTRLAMDVLGSITKLGRE